MSRAGVVLCGGKSSRMGAPKAWLPCGPGEVLLQRVVRVVGEAVPTVVVVAAPGQALPTLPAGVVVARDSEEGLGPLAGFIAGLAALPAGADAVYLTGCDVPFPSAAFVAAMLDRLSGVSAAVPWADGHPQPLAAAYRADVAQAAAGLVTEGARSLRALLAAVPVRRVEGEELRALDPTGRAWRGVNTPAEWGAVQRQISTAWRMESPGTNVPGH